MGKSPFERTVERVEYTTQLLLSAARGVEERMQHAVVDSRIRNGHAKFNWLRGWPIGQNLGG